MKYKIVDINNNFSSINGKKQNNTSAPLKKYIILHDTALYSPAAFVGYTGDTHINPNAGGIGKGAIVRGLIEVKTKVGDNTPSPYLHIVDSSIGKLNGGYVPPKAFTEYVSAKDEQNNSNASGHNQNPQGNFIVTKYATAQVYGLNAKGRLYSLPGLSGKIHGGAKVNGISTYKIDGHCQAQNNNDCPPSTTKSVVDINGEGVRFIRMEDLKPYNPTSPKTKNSKSSHSNAAGETTNTMSINWIGLIIGAAIGTGAAYLLNRKVVKETAEHKVIWVAGILLGGLAGNFAPELWAVKDSSKV